MKMILLYEAKVCLSFFVVVVVVFQSGYQIYNIGLDRKVCNYSFPYTFGTQDFAASVSQILTQMCIFPLTVQTLCLMFTYNKSINSFNFHSSVK